MNITKIAIAAGCGDNVYAMEEAEKMGAQAYLTGEVHCHIDNEYGKENMNIFCNLYAVSILVHLA